MKLSMPTYPAIVEPTGDFQMQNSPGTHGGPIVNGTDVWLILTQVITNVFTAWKTSDAGATWNRVNQAGEPSIGATNRDSMVRVDGVRLRLARRKNAGLGNEILTFNMSTGLWEAFIAAPGAAGAMQTGNVFGTFFEDVRRPFITVRSTGDMVVTDTYVDGAQYRPKYSVFSGGAWAVNPTLLGNAGGGTPQLCQSMILGAADRTHIFLVNTDRSLDHQVLTSANALSAISNVIVGASVFNPGANFSVCMNYGEPAFLASTGQLAIPFKRSDGFLGVLLATSADVPVWSIELVQNSKTIYGEPATLRQGITMASAFYDGIQLGIIFLSNENPPLIYRTDRVSGVWSAPAAIGTGSAGAVRQGVGSNGGSLFAAWFGDIAGTGLSGDPALMFYESGVGPGAPVFIKNQFIEPSTSKGIGGMLVLPDPRRYCCYQDGEDCCERHGEKFFVIRSKAPVWQAP
jgi:hypothetical protein